jgi:hypothetical protein
MRPSRSAQVALEETVKITQSLPWPPPGHPPLDVRRCPLLRYLRDRFADRWLPLSSRRSTCRSAHPVVSWCPQRLAQRALGRGGGTPPGTMSATATPVAQMPAIHVGRAGYLHVPQLQALKALQGSLRDSRDSRRGPAQSYLPGSRIIIPPVIDFLIPRDLTPISASGTFCCAVARTSAYDVLTPSLIVNVTADVRGARGARPFSSPAPFLS